MSQPQEGSFAYSETRAAAAKLTVAEDQGCDRSLKAAKLLRRDQSILQHTCRRMALTTPLYAANECGEWHVRVVEKLSDFTFCVLTAKKSILWHEVFTMFDNNNGR